MNKQNAFLIIFAVLIVAFVAALFSGGGASSLPETFVETGSPEAVTLRISGEYLSDEIWKTVSETLRSDFGLARESENDGFIQTDWQYPVESHLTQDYRRRLLIQFSEDRYSMTIWVNAEFQQKALLGIYRWWLSGTDDEFRDMYYEKFRKMIGKIP